jgi:hypothetical protein
MGFDRFFKYWFIFCGLLATAIIGTMIYAVICLVHKFL